MIGTARRHFGWLVALAAAMSPFQAHALGNCYFKKTPPVTLKNMGPCNFDPATLSFTGDPVTQARCLLTPVFEGGKLGAPLDRLPEALEVRVGSAEGLPTRKALQALLKEQGLSEHFADTLTRPVARAMDNDPDAPHARYFVLHDTSSPNYRHLPWPRSIDNDPKINNLKRYACANSIERAHVFINRMGAVFFPHDFAKPWRATKFEMATNFADKLKGLFLHVELVQPRRRHPRYRGNNDYLAPAPGFPPAQYDALATVYAVASARAGKWLIPAYHAVLDDGIYNKHDDPQNFDLHAFADSLSRLISRMHAYAD